jgi:hypothetical protein
MAEDVAVLAAELLIVVIEDLSEELAPEVIAEFTAFQSEMATTINADIAEGIEGGLSEDEATAQALQKSYDSMLEINGSEQVINQWAETMQEQGYEFESGAQAEEADFEDTDPESDPNKGEPDTADCVSDPSGPTCTGQTQTKLTRFINFLGSNWGTVVGIVVVSVGVVYTLIGRLALWVCGLVHKGECNGDGGCIQKACNSKLCTGSKSIVDFVRRYWIWLSGAIVVVGGVLSWYFRALSPIVVFGILELVVLSLKSVLGNLFSTTMCDVGAMSCLLSGKPLNC